MGFEDDARAGGECQLWGQQVRVWEAEYLRLRVRLQEAEVRLREDPRNAGVKASIAEIRQQLTNLEERSRCADDYPPEFALGADPHG